ncbi:MAG: ThiF family adenylyltransferase [Planctomycetota bacterium]
MLPGWDQERIESARVCVVGAGGLGSEVVLNLVQGGVGTIDIVDPDVVEASNLNRQLFTASQVGRNKAEALADNVVHFGALGSVVHAYPVYAEAFLDAARDTRIDLYIVGVDNDNARLAVSDHCFARQLPLVNVGLAVDGSGLEVLVQMPGGPCLRCWTGDREPRSSPCGGVPVTRPLASMAAALASHYGIELLLGVRPSQLAQVALFPSTMSTLRRQIPAPCRRCR